jgi:hypothetical protein
MPRKLPRIEPQFKYDFILYVSTGFDEVRKQKFLKFLFETTQHFLAFTYELDVDVIVEDKAITFKILGLKSPNLPISKPGPARFEYNFYNYSNGIYTLTIIKKQNVKNVFKISITGDDICLKGEPRKNKFVKLNIVQ